MATNRILLFGDSADAPVALLRQLLGKSRHSKNTQLFIQNSVDAVGREVQTLPPIERDAIGIFHSIQDLQECCENKRDPFNIAHIVLNFVARIGELILHAETDPSLLIGKSSPVIALSISGSMLAAAAAAVANDVGELIEVATFLAVVSCRQAIEIRRRGEKIEDGNGDWAFFALGEIVSQLPSILDRYHEQQRIPQYRKPYIGIQAVSWATVFGPPSVLKSLVASSTPLRASNVVMLPALGPAHAPHLSSPDFEYIMGNSGCLDKLVKQNYQLISGTTSRPIAGPNLKVLLRHILEDIFQRTANPEQVFDAGISLLNKEQSTSLFVLGNTSYLPSFLRTLRKKRVDPVIRSNSSSRENVDSHIRSESVAIIGMSGRFPGANSVEELWANVMERKELHKKVPSDRFDLDDFDPKSSVYGCFLDSPGLFDHKLFNVSPREAIQMDPGQRLLLHTTYEALEDAGVTTNGTRATDAKRVSTFIGVGADDWRELHQALGVDSHWIHGNERAFAPGRLNHYFNWEGATFCVDSACASSATAMALAFKALINRDCDTAIVGGANIIATPFWHSALTRGSFLSSTGGCKTFREDADGYCRGEAVGVLVLKRQDDALQDNDKIISVIRGYARNHSAEATSITHPHAGTQERLYKSLLYKTGLEPHDIGYVEFHGTGTTAGDSTELESISSVFTKDSSRQKPLAAGAIKANIGHSEAAAGILSLIKGALVLQKEIIPAQVGIPQKRGHYPSLKNGKILVPENALPFSSTSVGQGRRRILVNNFDAAGGNTCFVLEEPSKNVENKNEDPRPFHVVTISAHSTAALDNNKRRMHQFLKENRKISLANLAYTTTARRNHHSLRAAYCGANIEEIVEALASDLNGISQEPSIAGKKSPLVFVFSGQGGNYAGMGKDIFQTSSQFRGIISELEDTVAALGFESFTNLIADQNTRVESVSVVQQHLAIVCLQIALTRYWEICGIKPDVVIGHSIGEYAALCTAGVLSIFDTLYLVGKRAQLLQTKCVAGTHAMLSIAGTESEISSVLSDGHKGCEVACFNSPGMLVLSGERRELSTLETVLKERGLKCQFLDIPYAMHSCQMDSILPDFDSILGGVQFNKPKIKFISTLLGHLPEGALSVERDYLTRQTREPVQFQRAIASFVSEGFADTTPYWLEIGPSASCLGLIRSNVNAESSHLLASLKKNVNNWNSLSSNLTKFYMAGQSINWRAFHGDFADSLSLIDLPKYAFDMRDFWLTYPKRSVQPSQGNGVITDKDPTPDPISTCLHQLVKRIDNDHEQSAFFISEPSHSYFMPIVEGHKLSGTSVCPAGVFLDIALTAVRYLSNGEDLSLPSPALVVSDLQLVRPLVPTSNGVAKVIYSEVTSQKQQGTGFSVSFSDSLGSSSTAVAKCRVHLQDRSIFDTEAAKLYLSLQPKVSSLMAASEDGLADRIRGKVFYKLFSNLMGYSDLYKGIESAIVSDDFTEIFANVRFPAHDGDKADQRFSFSPYWTDILGQALGFLLNGDPNQGGDFVHIGGYIERFEVQARDISPENRYQIYAYISHSEGMENRGNAYISHGGMVIGILEGMRFHKMPRKSLHHLLGKKEAPPETKNSSPDMNSETVVGSKSSSAELAIPHNGQESNEHTASLTTAFLRILLDETGLLEGEIQPSANFSEIGVDSIFGISILGALKEETGVELGASFLSENPTLEDAQRALRIIENQQASLRPSDTNGVLSGHANEHVIEEDSSISSRKSNIVLIQSAPTPSRTSLFLIADGAGSAAAYAHLPQLAQNLQVFALESPWVKDPQNFTCSFNEAVAFYLKAICSKQPQGPYLLGGWSAGGVFAYEVSRLLLEAGEKVLGLIVIDIPAPRHVDRSKVSMPTFEIVENMGLLVGIDRATVNDSQQSIQLKQHMFSTVRCFSQLDPTPMAAGYRPDATYVIWATTLIGPGISNNENTESNKPNLDAWFYPMQHDFGPNGWDLLVGDTVNCFEIEGDHFSIMNNPNAKRLGQVLQQVAVKILNSCL